MTALLDEALLHPFEDVIDGYFPLATSLGQMLDRMDAPLAYVEITHAPMMQIPGLAHNAPVPLNIRAGRAGIVEELYLRVSRSEESIGLSGSGAWHWFDDADLETLDPMTRLAEPALVRGYLVLKRGVPVTVGAIRATSNPGPVPAPRFWAHLDRDDPHNKIVTLRQGGALAGDAE